MNTILSYAVQPGLSPIPGVKNIIAIGSGKGGVGKSTTAVNLALALQDSGARVGLLDADVYGPNQPQMLGVCEKPELINNKRLKPVMAHGLQTMSMGYWVHRDTPTIWRGPMISSALEQFTRDTAWDNLDYLIVDLPPGTGDIHLTLTKKIPIVGSVIVTTPQDVALLDARKALEMFNKMNIPVFGIIENMALHTCSACGHQEAIFGEGGAAKMSEITHVPMLGQLPLDISIREQADRGVPTVIFAPDSVLAKKYIEIAEALVAEMTKRPVNYTGKFPKIVVE